MNLRLPAGTFEIRPSLAAADVLGFTMIPSDAIDAWDVGSYLGGPCRIIGQSLEAEARICGWRDIPVCGFRGFRLEMDDVHLSAFLGCLIVQKEKAVGVVQSTFADIWGFPLDLIPKESADGIYHVPKHFAPGLKLVQNYEYHHYDWPYSALLLAHVWDAGRARDRNAFAGMPFALETSRGALILDPVMVKPILPIDTRCLYLGGLIIDPGSIITDIRPDSHLRVRKGCISKINTIKYPTFDDLLKVLSTVDSILLIVEEDDAISFNDLPACPALGDSFIRVREGAYCWGFCDGDVFLAIVPPIMAPPQPLHITPALPPPPAPLLAAAVQEEDDDLLLDLRSPTPPPAGEEDLLVSAFDEPESDDSAGVDTYKWSPDD